jgi:peptidyl-prolyl cis-trans isomerase SurA
MTTSSPAYRLLFLALGAALFLIGSPAPSVAQSIVVMVNGEPITDFDIDQRGKLDALTTHKTPSRQEIINELIDDKVKIKEGKKYGVEPGSSDIDQSYAGMASRMRVTPDQLTKSLEAKGVRPETLKMRMKAEMVWTSLVRGRYKERLQVGERDVANAVQAQTGEKLQIEGFEYKMQPIVLIVPRGSSQAAMDARHKEAEAYRGRVQSCEEANSLFRSTPNAAIRETVTKTSADLPDALRKVLDDTPVGRLTPPEVTKQGIEMVVLCSRKPTMIDTPKKREIREKMYVEKYEKTSKAYLQEVRKAAMIEYRDR